MLIIINMVFVAIIVIAIVATVIASVAIAIATVIICGHKRNLAQLSVAGLLAFHMVGVTSHCPNKCTCHAICSCWSRPNHAWLHDCRDRLCEQLRRPLRVCAAPHPQLLRRCIQLDQRIAYCPFGRPVPRGFKPRPLRLRLLERGRRRRARASRRSRGLERAQAAVHGLRHCCRLVLSEGVQCECNAS